MQDHFHKTSLRYGANPDLNPKHVGIGWSLGETSDLVKPSLANIPFTSRQQLEDKFTKFLVLACSCCCVRSFVESGCSTGSLKLDNDTCEIKMKGLTLNCFH